MSGSGEKQEGQTPEAEPAPVVADSVLGAGVAGSAAHPVPATPQPPLGDATTPPLGAELRRFVTYRILSNIQFTGAIWILFLKDRGLSLGEIGLAEAVFHLAPLTLELPTGAFADVFGRKWSLVAANLLSVISAILFLFIHDLWIALPAMYLAGAAMTFTSGATQAFLYDSLDESGTADRFQLVLGRILSVGFLVGGLSMWLGASLAEVSYGLAFGLSAATSLVAAWVGSSLREPEREKVQHRSMRRTIREAFGILRANPRLTALLLFGSALWTTVTIVELYAQAVFDDMGMSRWLVGLVLGGTFVLIAIGAWLTPQATKFGTFRHWTIGLSVMVIGGAIVLGFQLLILGLLLFLLFEFLSGVYEAYQGDQVNKGLAAPQRATVLSIEGWLFSITMVWMFPLVGWVADRWGWEFGFIPTCLLLVAALTSWLVLDRRYDEPATVLGEVPAGATPS